MAIDFQPSNPASKLDFQPASPSVDFQPEDKPVGPRSFSEMASALPREYTETVQKNRQSMKEALNQKVESGDILGNGMAALDVLGQGIQYVFSPIEAVGRWAVGDPVEQVTGKKGVSKDIGSDISVVSTFAADPVMMASKGTEAIRASKIGKDIEGALSPSTVSKDAGQTASIVRANSGALAGDTARASADLEQFRGTINRLPENVRFEFMDSIESGKPQSVPQLQPVADKIRGMLDEAKARVQSLGKGYLDKAIENYFPHIWKDPARATQVADQLEEELARQQSRRPIRGSASFLKQRTVDTIAAGRARGLELLSTDPIELTLIKIREMNKFYHGTLMADELKDSGLARFVKSTERPPPGWVKLDDKVFTARVANAKLAEGAEEANKGGITHFGDWYAPEDVAKVFNHYVGPGLAGRSALFDTVRHMGNSLNLLQLGISGFHATMTSLDTLVSNGARAIENAAHGEFGEAAKNIVGVSPIGAVTTFRAGSKLRAAALTSAKETLTPEMKKLVEALESGGGRVSMDSFYRATDKNGLVRSLKDGSFVRNVSDNFKTSPYWTVLKTPFDIATRAIEDVSAPLMEWLVPRYKLGVFSNMATDLIRRNPSMTQQEFRTAMQTAWDSVDNRLGQMVYDNVFWNKVGKDLAFITFRSVGWNLGTVRELGGSVVDTSRAIFALRSGDKAEFTHRMAYAIALPGVVGLYGAILTYLNTGKPPQTITDYFYPPTGGVTPQGYPDRVSIPNYTKDILQYNRAPVQTVLNKLNPLWAISSQLYQNRDFYGGIIANPDDPIIEQANQFGGYMAQQFLPFSVRGAERLEQENATPWQEVGAFFGFQPAPAFITHPETERAYQRRENLKAERRRLKENQ